MEEEEEGQRTVVPDVEVLVRRASLMGRWDRRFSSSSSSSSFSLATLKARLSSQTSCCRDSRRTWTEVVEDVNTNL